MHSLLIQKMLHSRSESSKLRVGVCILLALQCLCLRMAHTLPAHLSLRDEIQGLLATQKNESDFAEDIIKILNRDDRMKRQTSNCPGACTAVEESVLVEQFNNMYANPYRRCLDLLKINVTLSDSTSGSVYTGIGSTFDSRCVQDIEQSDQECFSAENSQGEQARIVRDLGKDYFPRYVIDLECREYGECISSPKKVTVNVLRRTSDQTCNEDGTAKYESTGVLVTLACSFHL